MFFFLSDNDCWTPRSFLRLSVRIEVVPSFIDVLGTRGCHFLRKGVSPKYTGGHKFLERKKGGHQIFDDQNVGSHKMTTDSVFILLKKTDFNKC